MNSILLDDEFPSKEALMDIRDDGNPRYIATTGERLLYCQPDFYSNGSKMISAYVGVVIMFVMAVYGR